MNNRLAKFKVNKDKVMKAMKEDQGRSDDPRILPLYKLNAKEEQSIKCLILPFKDESLVKKVSVIGPKAKGQKDDKGNSKRIKGVENIGFAGQDGIINQRKIDFFVEAKETGNQSLKEVGLRLMETESRYINVLPLDCPFELEEVESGNPIRLVNLPQAVYNEIQKVLDSGDMEPEDLLNYPIIIKRSIKSDTKQPTYELSHIARKPVSDADLDYYDDEDWEKINGTGKGEGVYDLSDFKGLDYPVPTEEEEEAWLAKSIPLIRKALGHEGYEDAGDESQEEEKKSDVGNKSKLVDKGSLADRLNRSKAKSEPVEEEHPEPEDSVEEEQYEDEGVNETQESEEPSDEKLSGRAAMMARLKNRNK